MKIETLQGISAAVVRKIFADNVTVGGAPVFLGILPRGITTIPSADVYMIRPITTDIHFALDAVPTTVGLNAARLVAGNEYVFPVHPEVQTLGFLSAGGDSSNVIVYVRGFAVR